MSRVKLPSQPVVGKPAHEAEPTSEADVPSDGADEIGEAMIRDLPRTMGGSAHPASDPSETRA